MSKSALVSLPLLAAFFLVLVGCPASQPGGPVAGGKPSADAVPSKSEPRPAETQPPRSPQSASKPAGQALVQKRPLTADAHNARQPYATAGHTARPAGGYPNDEKRRDPVAMNGPIFQGWTKPKLALVLSGEQLGYIEPCGCAGLENQKGGLRRRHTLLQQLRADGWPVVPLDNGGLIHRFGLQTEIKYQTTVDGLKTMGYEAIGFGDDDLKLPAASLLSATLDVQPVVSANVSLLGFEPNRFRIVEAGGLRIGVTAVLGADLQKGINNPEVQIRPARKALAEVLPKMKGRCDYLVLLAHASPKESQALALEFPDFDVVVTAGGADEPPHEFRRVEGGKALFVEVGHKGMYAVVLGFYDDPKTPLRYQRVPLDARFKDSPQIDQLLTSYQEQLQQLGWQGLGLQPVANPRGAFVGSETCGDCHDAEFSIWESTPHAHATETLTKLEPVRHFDPECISCHATGWNPQEYFPYTSGYDNLKTTPLLTGNGCENCHGPGADHVAAENGEGNDAQRKRLREAMRLVLNDETKETQRQACMECHDLDNSPDFDFDTYWPQVEH